MSDWQMTEDQIKHMVNRFLGWRLPESFSPDAGISFKAAFNEHTAHPTKHEPVGTNRFSADQADAMVRHMIDGMAAVGDWQPIETAPKGRRIIAGYINRAGNWRTIIAKFYPAGTLESDDDSDSNFAPEGWYEEADAYDHSLSVECPPTHWMPLPEPPK